ncbi:antirestriction protein ArdA [Bacillus haynesii]|uniref:antirestriction protein ArdA n=1 Tax=Bacillus haynesii TaxID=1925021 RepID=UPI00227EBD97|nr:antirestriction protein ArdA [Bacillus haynesii]MCY9324054.1 antirestriction protein ArdA [Bacillus haynesii]
MQNFNITLSGILNHEMRTVEFPASQSTVADAVAAVSNFGQRDFEIVDHDADFPIEYLDVVLLNAIANMTASDYQVFLTFVNGGCQLQEAYDYAIHYSYRLYNNVEDAGDIAYQILENDDMFQALPAYIKRHFDYDSYGEEFESTNSVYWDVKNKRAVHIL